MSRFIVLIGIIVLITVEIIFKIIELYQLNERKAFLLEFGDKFNKYCESRGLNNEVYIWLINRSHKMQRELGVFGLIDYQAPFSNRMVNNYQIILNALPEVRQEYQMGLGHDHAHLVSETLIRFDGWIEDVKESQRKKLVNPIVLFRDSIRRIIVFPIWLLKELGVFSIRVADMLTGNYLFTLISSLITLLGLVSAIITIVSGWDTLIKIINTVISNFV